MLLIKLAREAAEKRAADEAEWKLREAHLQDRLEKLKKLVLAEVLQMDLEPCKYGKFIVTQEDGAVIFAKFPEEMGLSFGYVSVTIVTLSPFNGHRNTAVRVLELGSKMSAQELVGNPVIPIVYAKVIGPDRNFTIFSCTDHEDSEVRFFDAVGKALSVWF
jgi:hypothetical protein